MKSCSSNYKRCLYRPYGKPIQLFELYLNGGTVPSHYYCANNEDIIFNGINYTALGLTRNPIKLDDGTVLNSIEVGLDNVDLEFKQLVLKGIFTRKRIVIKLVDADMCITTLVNPFTSSGIEVVDSDTFTKITSTSNYDQQVYARNGFVQDVFCSSKSGDSTKRVLFGLSTNPSGNASFGLIDYAIYLDGSSNNASIMESGITKQNIVGGFTINDIFKITYDGTNIKYYKNGGSVVRTTPRIVGLPLYFDSTFYSSGSCLDNVQFGPIVGPTDYIVLFDGELDEPKGDDHWITMEIEPFSMFQREYPRKIFQSGCNSTFGDTECTLILDSYKISGIVSASISSSSFEYSVNGTNLEKEYCTNNDFENDMNSWNVMNNDRFNNCFITNGYVYLDDPIPHSGNKCLGIYSWNPKDMIVFQNVSIDPGLPYVLSFWIYVVNGSGNPWFTIFDYVNNTAIIPGNGFSVVTGQWVNYSTTFSTPSNCNSISLGLMPGNPNGTVYYDDVSIKQDWTQKDFLVPGYIQFTSGILKDVIRPILSNDTSNSTLSLRIPFPFSPNVGDTFTVQRTCKKDVGTCQKFSNYINYQGFPHAPRQPVF